MQFFLQQKLQAVEKFALRVCLKSWKLSYDELIVRAGIESLTFRRKIAILLFIYKVLYKLLHMPDALFSSITSRQSSRLSHVLALKPYRSSTTRFQSSAIPNRINLWNSLPFSLDSCTPINHLKLLIVALTLAYCYFVYYLKKSIVT